MTFKYFFIVFLGFITAADAQVTIQDADGKEPPEKVFFAFDEHNIPWKNNLSLSMVKPTKYETNPVVRRGAKGSVDEWVVQFYGSVIYHEGKFKMWYIAADDESLQSIKKGRGYEGIAPAYAESQDGINWVKPNLGLVAHRGNKDNNLVLIETPEVAGLHLIVIHDEEEKDNAKKFKMMLTVSAKMNGGKLKTETSIPLFSADGLRWKTGKEVHFDKGVMDESGLSMPPVYFEQGGLYKWKGAYHLAGQQFSWWVPDSKPVGRVMTIFRSPDLLSWDPSMAYSFRRDIYVNPPAKANEAEEAHLASSVWHRGNVLLGLYGLWHGAKEWEKRSMDLGFMFSNDGINFREPLRDFAIIPKGEEGTWDQGGLLQGQGFANVGEKTYIWYGSWDMTKPSYPPRGGVGLVTLRRDGFGYLGASSKRSDAHFITRTIEKSELTDKKQKLYLNLDGVSKSAPVKVELVDGQGRLLAGYSGSSAALVEKSGVREEILWPGKKGLSKIKVPFAIKVTYPTGEKVQVFALYL